MFAYLLICIFTRMKRTILALSFALALIPVTAQVGWQWARSAGAANADAGTRVAAGPGGTSAATGYYTDTITFSSQHVSAGTQDAFVVKYSTSGTPLWSRSFGNVDADEGRGIAIDGQGHVYVAGMFKGIVAFGSTNLNSGTSVSIFLTKLDASTGNVVWAKAVTGYGLAQSVQDIALDAGGNIFMTGLMDTKILFNPGTFDSIPVPAAGGGLRDMYIAKFDPTGKALWAKSGGGNSFDGGYSVTVDPVGDPIVGGYFTGTATFGGNVIISSLGRDFLLAKYQSSSGNCIWARQGNQSINGDDHVYGVATDNLGYIYMIGEYYVGTSDYDVVIRKYNPSATQIKWSKTISAFAHTYGADISVGGPYVWATGTFGGGSGNFYGNSVSSSGVQACYLAGLDTAGTSLGVQVGQGTAVGGYGVGTDAGSGTYVYVTGAFDGPKGQQATFGSQTTSGLKGSTDVFVAHYGFGVSVKEEQMLAFNVFPNPSQDGTFHISSEIPSEKLKIEVLNLLGEVVFAGDGKNTIDISAMPKGVYLLRVNGATQKLLHQ